MSDVVPIVRHMLVCDDVRLDPDNPHKVHVFGLVSTIQSSAEPSFPLLHPQLCIYLQVTGGRGSGEGEIVVVRADSEETGFASAAHALSFPANPLSVTGIVFRIQDCLFPEPGLYWVQFRYNEQTLAREPLLVR
jgi:hypothetical protein